MYTLTSVISVGEAAISRNPATTNSGTNAIIDRQPEPLRQPADGEELQQHERTMLTASSMRPRKAVRSAPSGKWMPQQVRLLQVQERGHRRHQEHEERDAAEVAAR